MAHAKLLATVVRDGCKAFTDRYKKQKEQYEIAAERAIGEDAAKAERVYALAKAAVDCFGSHATICLTDDEFEVIEIDCEFPFFPGLNQS